jgi:chemotaxis protein MotB
MQDAIQNLKFKCLLLIGLVSIFLITGCTNWKKKYDNLLVVHKNLQGRYEYLESQKRQLSAQVTQDQQTIRDLERKIAERQSAAKASGFEGYEVSYDPSAGTITVTLPNAILFDSGQASLKKATSTELNHIRSVLQQKYSNRPIDVVGHTDSDPIKKSKWKDNLELSSQRALTVVRYLIDRGVDRKRIRAVGCGAARPIASNASASGKARNRRVEIVVYMKGGG